MKLNKAKRVIELLNARIENIKKEQSKFDLEQYLLINNAQDASSKYVDSDEYKQFCYLEGKADLLRQLSEVLLYDSCFDETGDLSHIKNTYKNNYHLFLDGFIDSFLEVTDL